MLQEY